MVETSAFAIEHFTRLPRVVGLVVSPDGHRLVATLEAPDEKAARYVTSLHEIDPEGVRPSSRITHSERGESAPVLTDAILHFISRRGSEEDDAELYALTAGAEAHSIASYPGGVRGPLVAARDGTLLLSADRPLLTSGDGAEWRKVRRERKVSAILHTGFPIRYWDHELGALSPRMLLLRPGATEPEDLIGDAGLELVEASYDLSADGSIAVTTWTEPQPGGLAQTSLAVVDIASGERRLLRAEPDFNLSLPRINPQATLVASLCGRDGDFQTLLSLRVRIDRLGDGTAEPLTVDCGDAFPTELCWSGDGSLLFVAAEWHSHGVVLGIDPTSGSIVRRLACDASYSCLSSDASGRLFALRSTPAKPPTPVRLDPTAADQTPRLLPSPAATPDVPGRLMELTTSSDDGRNLHAWLCLPSLMLTPPPLLVWIHGGPFTSWNSWSWRWNPWVAVARGYAVLLPDPALSVGYGDEFLRCAWPHRAERVWRDVETVLDATVARDDIDGDHVACMGGSFGGYMTNWIAGHTDRFRAIVTHAGLWALDQQHTTTDAADWKGRLVGPPSEHPQWYAENSPHNFADNITTPMLVIHGNRDYRVPVSEALRLWWDLCSRHLGDPNELPHRFLHFTDENHWVLRPADAEIWYSTVLGFCDRHLRGIEVEPSALL